MSARLDSLHHTCRARGWKLRAALVRPAGLERMVVQLQVQTALHILGAPVGMSLDEQARFLGRMLRAEERA